MSEFPKWLLGMAGFCLVPLLLSIFYLSGAFLPFGTSTNGFVNFLLYIAKQLLWLVPVILFFVSLDRYRRGYTKAAALCAAAGDIVSAAAVGLLFL